MSTQVARNPADSGRQYNQAEAFLNERLAGDRRDRRNVRN